MVSKPGLCEDRGVRMTLSFLVDVPIEAVFRYLSDPSLMTAQLAPTYTIEPQGQIAEGNELTLGGPGMALPWHMRVVGVKPPTLIEMLVWGEDHPDRVGHASYDLESTGQGTKVRGTMQTRLGWRLEAGMLLMRPFLTLQARRGNRRIAAAIESRYRSGRLT